MGKMSYTINIGDRYESFNMKNAGDDIEIRDILGNMAFPTKELIKKLYQEIIRLEELNE